MKIVEKLRYGNKLLTMTCVSDASLIWQYGSLLALLTCKSGPVSDLIAQLAEIKSCDSVPSSFSKKQLIDNSKL